MNADDILRVIQKGFTLIEAFRQTAESLSPALKAMYELVEKQRSGAEVSEAELKAVEDTLDEQLNIFNEPLPDDESES